MESLLNRYRNITVLLLVIVAQLMLLAFQVKNDQDVRIIRIWTVTAVTPVARVVEGFRGGGLGFVRNYILLHDTNEENRKLKEELGKLKLENIFLKDQLNTADRAKALQVFQEHTPSKTVAATVILASAGSNQNVRFLDRGTFSGVQRGMAVVTPDGIVGKIIAAYPSASEMMLLTDSEFAAGVISASGVRGTLKGQGTPTCKVDYVASEEKIEPGEILYTSGDDRIFPRGFPVGVVKVARKSQPFQEIYVDPTGIQHGVEDVLILIQGVQQEIPKQTAVASQPVYIAPPPLGTTAAQTPESAAPAPAGTDMDKLREHYKALGEAQNHNYGEGGPGSKPPDFNMKLPSAGGASGRGAAPPAGAVPAPNGAAGRGPATSNSAAPPPSNPPAAKPAAQPGAGAPGRGAVNPNPAVAPPKNPQTAPPPAPGRAGQPPAVILPPNQTGPSRRANQANGPGGPVR